MFNMTNVEYVVFDYDDTLCIHEEHYGSDDTYHYYAAAMREGASYWSKCNSNVHMKAFINFLKDKKIPMGLISWCGFYPIMKAKQDWVNNEYGYKMENLCVGSRLGKIDALKAISELYSIDTANILIVDDRSDTLDDAARAGFMAASPMEIVNYVTNNNLLQ